MEFSNRLYELRKQKGLSQEELAGRIHVSRQTVSKWELGDSTPDLEKLVALGDLFEISLDEMVLGKKAESEQIPVEKTETFLEQVEEKVLTQENKARAKKVLKILGIVAGIFLSIDVISMILYFLLVGAPK
ncbi:MAG: helix-turn-helix domain-containing protein [Ruminococcus sp.]|nr:helix-turn-helix domain-containing protein [Ruminococcus sp.]